MRHRFQEYVGIFHSHRTIEPQQLDVGFETIPILNICTLSINYKIKNLMQNYLVTAVQQDLTDNKDEITNEEKYQVVLDGICKERGKWKARFDKKHAVPH